MKIAKVPVEFTCSSGLPPFRGLATLENYVHEYILKHSEIESERTYLPIHWADYLVEQAKEWSSDSLGNLIAFSEALPHEPYWTLTQLDNGPYIGISDCITLGVGDDRTDITIPLTRASRGLARNENPAILASFVGRISSPEREQMKGLLTGKKGFEIITVQDPISEEMFVEKMMDSVFALCPRGNIAQTFRLYEAMDFGCIPVYISDNFVTPFIDQLNWKDFCVLVESKDIASIPDILSSFDSSSISRLRKNVTGVYNTYFSMMGLCNQIVRIVGAF